jgi:hypothetical protein
MIVKRIGNVPDAEDLTAEVFLAALSLNPWDDLIDVA